MITLKDIRKAHPGVASPTDKDYAKIAETAKAMLSYTQFGAGRSEEELKRMAIKLTMYFEDVVSEIGLWHSFVQKHQQLYGKPLPFYDIYGTCDTDDLHEEDIRYLLWDSTLDDEDKETLINPENEVLKQAAQTAYIYFRELFEDTPINEDLYDYFHEASFTDNFYEVRQLLKWYYFDCCITAGRFKDSNFEEKLDYQMELCQGNRQVAQSAAEAAIAFKYNVGPLALKPQEWLEAILNIHGQKAKAQVVATIEAKDIEPYILESYDRESVTLRSIDDEQMRISRNNYFYVQTTLLKDKDINGCVGSFAKNA